MTATAQAWLRAYAMLALRINRWVTKTAGGTVLIYQGPDEWSAEVEAEDPPLPGRLADDADRLLDDLPFDAYLAGQVRAMRAVARRLAGENLPLPGYARQCLGMEPEWVPESQLEAAHAQLDEALPKTSGSLTDRLHAWEAHSLASAQMERLPGLVGKAVAETRARTNLIVPLPPDEVVDCRLAFPGGRASPRRTEIDDLHQQQPSVQPGRPAVRGHTRRPPRAHRHSLLKEIHLVNEQGRLDQRVRFMLSPSFVISEGLGLHAQGILFPDDQAQAWLADNILTEQGIRPDGSDFAAIHHAKTVLWGAWGNTAFLAAQGRPDTEIVDYLSRWALLNEAELGPARNSLNAPGMDIYVLGYFHGWRLLNSWLNSPDRDDRIRRLLTEQLLPTDLETEQDPRPLS